MPEDKRTLPFRIGADPEFLLFQGVKALDAQALLRNFLDGKPTIQRVEENHGGGYSIGNAGELGWDGASSTGEVRPRASTRPEEVTANCQTLVRVLTNNIPAVDFTTLSIGSPIGGHIHLDIPSSLIPYSYLFGEVHDQESQRIKNRVEKLIATFSIPVILSEHRISSAGRLSGEYGNADDMRFGPHGPGFTAEVRGISAEWLTSPHLTKATLAYYGVVWDEIIRRHEDLIKDKAALKTKGHIETIQRMLMSDYKVVEHAVLNRIRKLVRTFRLYEEFKDEVELILHPERTFKEKERLGWCLNNGWKGEKKMKNPTKKDLLSEKKVAEKLKKDRNISLEDGYHIPYNDDYNVQFFAKAVIDRIESLNWKLRNEYFLFGLKKGIEGYAAYDIESGDYFSIPTNSPKNATKKSCSKMAERFTSETQRHIRIDPKTGKTRIAGKNQVVIGIPYDVRAENNTRGLINLIWSIESKRSKAQPIKNFPVPRAEKSESDEDIYRTANSNASEKKANTTGSNLRHAFASPHQLGENILNVNPQSLAADNREE